MIYILLLWLGSDATLPTETTAKQETTAKNKYKMPLPVFKDFDKDASGTLESLCVTHDEYSS